MNRKPPKMRRHKTGQWMVRYAGEDHYLGRDRKAAQAKYLEHVKQWGEWRAHRDTMRPVVVTDRRLTVSEVLERFLELKAAEGGPRRRLYYESSMALFSREYRDYPADQVRAKHLLDYKLDLLDLKYAPKTINHHLGCLRSMFNWASSMELIPPVNLSGVNGLRVPRTVNKAYQYDEVWAFIRSVPEHLGNWLAVQFLAAMRPSEVPRLVLGRGEYEEPWLFRLTESKSEWRTGVPRRIVLSDAALSFLARCEPRWTRADSYHTALERAVTDGPFADYDAHPLRHSAATYLGQQGVAREQIDHLLGHLPAAVSFAYNPVQWEPLRPVAARISASMLPRP